MNLSKVVKLFFLTTCIKNSIGKPLADSSYPTDYNALVPWPLIGEKFFIDLSGSKGEPFSTINVTLPSGSDQPAVTFKTINGLPNINSNDIYAGIIYKDAGGKTQYQKTILEMKN